METLAPREFNAGLAEAVKHAMLDPKALTWMQNHDTPRAEDTNWEEMTRWFEHMSLTKRTIVDADLNEQSERNQLNLGHTVAHALEAATADQGEPLLHGEAVAVGLRFALFEASEGVLSKEPLGEESAADSTWIEHWLQAHLPLPELIWPAAEVLWHWMIHDKKNVHVEVRDMAWRGVGQIHWPVTWEKSAFEATWTRFLRLTFNET
jgi:3-dehydroquinate synthase